ncbi:MAG: hypothetical protein QOG62_992 [Thermoleophilaceae bacterium]|jgi:hypothetical protein|nr:hypothetical protein [Thermoleophilaceae bacterium]
MRFKMIGVLAAVAAMSLGAGVGPAVAKKHDGKRNNTFIENDCKRLAQKPRHISLDCGKNKRHSDDSELRKVRYRNKNYGKNNTRARANLHIAGVTTGRTQVKLRFKNLKKCTNKHTKGGGVDKKSEVYRKVNVKLKNPAPGVKKRWNEKLGCG